MKYIRTKDGIYKSKRNPIEKDCLVIGEKENGEIGLVRKDIIAKADTIEELCDEFVVCLKDGDKLLMDGDIRSAKDFFFGYGGLRKTEKVFGAIWTDKGLIFVARMNNEGVLELL